MADGDNRLEMMSLYIDGGLSPEETKQFQEMMEESEETRDEFFAMKELVDNLGKLDNVPLPEGFHQRAMAHIHQSKAQEKKGRLSGKRLITGLPAAAAAIAAFFVLSLAIISFDRPLTEQAGKNTGSVNTAYLAGDMSPMATEAVTAGETEKDAGTGYALAAAPEAEAGAALRNFDESELAFMEDSALQSVPAAKTADTYQVTECHISIAVTDVNQAAAALDHFSGKNVSSSVHMDASGNLNGYFVREVPSWEYSGVMLGLSSLGEVTSRNTSQFSVYFNYTDANARLGAKQEEYTRLLAMMSKTDTVDNMLIVEQRINEVISEVEYWQGEVNRFTMNTSSPKLYISLYQAPGTASLAAGQPGFSETVARTVTASVHVTRGVLAKIMVILAALALPGGIVLAAVLLCRFIVKKMGGRMPNKGGR